MSPDDMLRPNGHIVFPIDGIEYDIARPKNREYNPLLASAVAAQNKLSKINDNDDMPVDQKDFETLQTVGEWIVEVLTTLGTPKFQGTWEDLEPWILENKINKWIAHWRTTPLEISGS